MDSKTRAVGKEIDTLQIVSCARLNTVLSIYSISGVYFNSSRKRFNRSMLLSHYSTMYFFEDLVGRHYIYWVGIDIECILLSVLEEIDCCRSCIDYTIWYNIGLITSC